MAKLTSSLEVDTHLGSGVQAMVCFFAPLWAKTLIFENTRSGAALLVFKNERMPLVS